jgi:hypothetical protein
MNSHTYRLASSLGSVPCSNICRMQARWLAPTSALPPIKLQTHGPCWRLSVVFIAPSDGKAVQGTPQEPKHRGPRAPRPNLRVWYNTAVQQSPNPVVSVCACLPVTCELKPPHPTSLSSLASAEGRLPDLGPPGDRWLQRCVDAPEANSLARSQCPLLAAAWSGSCCSRLGASKQGGAAREAVCLGLAVLVRHHELLCVKRRFAAWGAGLPSRGTVPRVRLPFMDHTDPYGSMDQRTHHARLAAWACSRACAPPAACESSCARQQLACHRTLI